MFNSLVPNGAIYLSLIYIQRVDNSHVIPLRVGGVKEIDWNENITQTTQANALHDEQIDP